MVLIYNNSSRPFAHLQEELGAGSESGPSQSIRTQTTDEILASLGIAPASAGGNDR